MGEVDRTLQEVKKKAEDAVKNAEKKLENGLRSFDERDYIEALKSFYESSKYAGKAVGLTYGLDYTKKYDVGKYLKKNKNIFPEWFAREIDATAEVIDSLEKNRPKVVVFLVAQPMWYMYEYSPEEYEAKAKKLYPKIKKTIENCLKLVQQHD
jgi:hypothetical protein